MKNNLCETFWKFHSRNFFVHVENRAIIMQSHAPKKIRIRSRPWKVRVTSLIFSQFSGIFHHFATINPFNVDHFVYSGFKWTRNRVCINLYFCAIIHLFFCKNVTSYSDELSIISISFFSKLFGRYPFSWGHWFRLLVTSTPGFKACQHGGQVVFEPSSKMMIFFIKFQGSFIVDHSLNYLVS